MNNFVRTSEVTQINDIRLTLWKSIYSSFANMNSLTTHLNENFKPLSLDGVDYNFEDMSIILRLNDKYNFRDGEIETNIKNSYKEFIKDMYSSGKIECETCCECSKRIDSLFFITHVPGRILNDSGIVKIHL